MTLLTAMSDPWWFWKLSTYNKIRFTAIVLVGFCAFDFYFKVDFKEKTKLLKQEMLNVCRIDNQCKLVVETNFEECFNKNYDRDAVGLYNGFDSEKFSKCMNKKGEVKYFKPIRLSDL